MLETTYEHAQGVARVRDALLIVEGLRRLDTGAVLIRQIDCVTGSVRMGVEIAPRPQYGLVAPALEGFGRELCVRDGMHELMLGGVAELELHGTRVRGEIILEAGDTRTLWCRCGTSTQRIPFDPETVLDTTVQAWQVWSSEHEPALETFRDLVRPSALVLRGLIHEPSGAMVAAPTTSLPEIPGGTANWDYRYAWLRDSSFGVRALRVAACPGEAARYFRWLVRAAADGEDEGDTQVVFGVDGERMLEEVSLDHLAGYAASRPVRIGNGAWKQRQLDIYGHVLEAAAVLAADDEEDDFDESACRFLRQLATRAAAGWREPDAGIWESRGPERQNISSKALCWAALDRASRLAGNIGATHTQAQAWATERDLISTWIADHAWSEDRRSFVRSPGEHVLDASLLLLPLVGLTDATDPRMSATIDRIREELGEDGFLRRWSDTEDAPFIACSFWLVECLLLRGDLTAAGELFERICAAANDLALLAEEFDPSRGELRGNMPLLLSHVGLVNAAARLETSLARDVAV